MEKRKSSKIGVIGSIGLAGLAALSGFTPPAANLGAVTLQVEQQQNTQKQTPAPVAKTNQISQLPVNIGGVEMLGKKDDFGIPPHIYGMYHARRGTHKKSNKK